MMYTILGNKDYTNKEISKLTGGINKENISIYNLDNKETNINDIIIDLDTISLFGEKVVIINDIEKLKDDSKLIKYLNNPNDNILIMTNLKELDKRKKLTKIIKDKTKIIDLINFDLRNYIKDNLEDYNMSFKDINLLIDYCNNNIRRIDNELDKLKLYKFEDKNITEIDIKKIVKRNYDSTIFNLIDSINSKDIKKIRIIYKELISLGDSDDRIMYTIANHYRLLYQISIKIKTLTDDEIIGEYKMHPYRLAKLKEQLNFVSEEEMLNILKKISDIDIDYKMGKVNLSDELFLFFERL